MLNLYQELPESLLYLLMVDMVMWTQKETLILIHIPGTINNLHDASMKIQNGVSSKQVQPCDTWLQEHRKAWISAATQPFNRKLIRHISGPVLCYGIPLLWLLCWNQPPYSSHILEPHSTWTPILVPITLSITCSMFAFSTLFKIGAGKETSCSFIYL